MIAVIPVRDGVLPAGGAEAAAECNGRVLVAVDRRSDEVDDAIAALEAEGRLRVLGTDVRVIGLGSFAPGRWASELAPMLTDDALVVIPASPDGRDLAPRLAHLLGRPLYAGSVQVTEERIVVGREAGRALHVHRRSGPCIATFQPGVRGTDPTPPHDHAPVVVTGGVARERIADAEVVSVLPPDVTTMDLAEAPRIVGGGAGLDGADRFAQLARIAATIGAAMGATRVITDRNWVEHERQIGTTGVIVDPTLYLSFGISGAVQHTSGLGTPRHVISVNTDPHCPMMQMSDLAVVSDANATLDHLERFLATASVATPTPAPAGDPEAVS